MQTRSGRLLAKPIAWPTGAVTTQGEQLPRNQSKSLCGGTRNG
jgi:hypothetical protein